MWKAKGQFDWPWVSVIKGDVHTATENKTTSPEIPSLDGSRYLYSTITLSNNNKSMKQKVAFLIKVLVLLW